MKWHDSGTSFETLDFGNKTMERRQKCCLLTKGEGNSLKIWRKVFFFFRSFRSHHRPSLDEHRSPRVILNIFPTYARITNPCSVYHQTEYSDASSANTKQSKTRDFSLKLNYFLLNIGMEPTSTFCRSFVCRRAAPKAPNKHKPDNHSPIGYKFQ